MLKEAKWPGNVRQLNNIIERLIIMSSDGIIDSTMVEEVLDYSNKDNFKGNSVVRNNRLEIKEDCTEEELIKEH